MMKSVRYGDNDMDKIEIILGASILLLVSVVAGCEIESNGTVGTSPDIPVISDEVIVDFFDNPQPVNTGFISDADGFNYIDDAFRGTSNPTFADGNYDPSQGVTDGALHLSVGGLNDDDILGMSGGWAINFDTSSTSDVTISFRYRLEISGGFESDEWIEMLMSLDGTQFGSGGNDYVFQHVGGPQGPTIDSGWQLFEVTIYNVASGSHQLVIGAYNNKKTFNDEFVEAWIDDVVVSSAVLDAIAIHSPEIVLCLGKALICREGVQFESNFVVLLNTKSSVVQPT